MAESIVKVRITYTNGDSDQQTIDVKNLVNMSIIKYVEKYTTSRKVKSVTVL